MIAVITETEYHSVFSTSDIYIPTAYNYRQFQEAYNNCTRLEEPAEVDDSRPPNTVAILQRYTAYLRGVPGGSQGEIVIQRRLRAVSSNKSVEGWLLINK